MKHINVREVIGTNFDHEDAIVLRNFIKENLHSDITLDFSGISKVPSTFLCCLFTDLINAQGRDYVFSRINVKNMTNFSDYKRVILGTAF